MSVRIIKAEFDPASRITQMLDNSEPRLRVRFLATIARIEDAQTLEQIANLLSTGRVDEALQFADRAIGIFASNINNVYVNAGQATAEHLGSVLDIVVDFDQTNFRAVDQMRRNRLSFIREFSSEQRRATHEALLQGTLEGQNPIGQARRFKESIGLTQAQMRAVNNYRESLRNLSVDALNRELRDRRFDPTVRRAIDNATPLSDKQIDKLTSRYRQRYIQYRSRVIARTEALRSVHEGTEELYKQALELGDLRSDQLIREWNTASDSRVRDSHESMNGQQQPFDIPFVTGNGNFLMYPGDPSAPASETIQCRCVVSTRIDT